MATPTPGRRGVDSSDELEVVLSAPRTARRDDRCRGDHGPTQRVALQASACRGCARHAWCERVERGPPHPIATPRVINGHPFGRVSRRARGGISKITPAATLVVVARLRRHLARERAPTMCVGLLEWGGRFAARTAARQGTAPEASASTADAGQALLEVCVLGAWSAAGGDTGRWST